jgi:hypothetical protein
LALRYHRRQHRENERGNGLYNSAAFNALDMTEKGWVNFSLGMLFTKLFADKLLDMPWLFHFKWFQGHNSVGTLPGKSTPDFIGLDTTGPHYHALEAKGRSGGFSSTTMKKAKNQALQAISVNRSPCVMHIGSMLYRVGSNELAMAMHDPRPEGEPGNSKILSRLGRVLPHRMGAG